VRKTAGNVECRGGNGVVQVEQVAGASRFSRRRKTTRQRVNEIESAKVKRRAVVVKCAALWESFIACIFLPFAVRSLARTC